MSNEGRTKLVRAMIPLEVLYQQILHWYYTEMAEEFQDELLRSIKTIRELIFNQESKGEKNEQ